MTFALDKWRCRRNSSLHREYQVDDYSGVSVRRHADERMNSVERWQATALRLEAEIRTQTGQHLCVLQAISPIRFATERVPILKFRATVIVTSTIRLSNAVMSIEPLANVRSLQYETSVSPLLREIGDSARDVDLHASMGLA